MDVPFVRPFGISGLPRSFQISESPLELCSGTHEPRNDSRILEDSNSQLEPAAQSHKFRSIGMNFDIETHDLGPLQEGS